MPSKEISVILAYGFDAAGFNAPPEAIEGRGFKVRWVNYQENVSLDTGDGLITIQGIFERIRYRDELYGGTYTDVDVDQALMLERERQLLNLLRSGGWVCFLVRDIIDTVPHGYDIRRIANTGLCQRVLNLVGINWTLARDWMAGVTSTRDEFRVYIEKFGVAKTMFSPVPGDRAMKVLAKARGAAVGVVVGENVLFLPFHTTNTDAAGARNLVGLVAESVVAYRQKVIIELPDWVHALSFATEERLLEERSALQKQLVDVDKAIETWRNHKAILVASGDLLKSSVVEILERYFCLQVDPIDEGREDFKIVGGETVIALGETKGTNSGIKREHINQVDSHRERSGLGPEVPGLLIINSQMDLAGIAKRLETTVAAEQIAHARRLNILIVRTIDLLYLMRRLEAETNRAGAFVSILSRGGGWLKA